MHARTQIHTQPCAQLRAHATTHAHSHARARAHVHTHAQSLTHTLIVAIYRIRFPALSAIRCQPRAHAATRARVRHTRTQTRIHARTHAQSLTHCHNRSKIPTSQKFPIGTPEAYILVEIVDVIGPVTVMRIVSSSKVVLALELKQSVSSTSPENTVDR